VVNQPLVTVVVPTFNNQNTIAACLESIAAQDYKRIEIVVVDNYSTDLTYQIAARYADVIVQHGHERSEQANFGVSLASGEFILRLDADLVSDSGLLSECVTLVERGCDAVEVHNSPDPTIGWIARARRFEYDLIKGDPRRNSARFVRKIIYESIGGLDARLVAGEDFDFQNRLNASGAVTAFAQKETISISEPTSLIRMLSKFYRYGRQAVIFARVNPNRPKGQFDISSIGQKLNLQKWRAYRDHPIVASTFLIYFMLKIAAGGCGYWSGKFIQSVDAHRKQQCLRSSP
jgi:glycosyltransferase involved in cell wall biosynthesis